MTTMTIIDVVNIVYPGQLDIGNIAFGQGIDGPIFITRWEVDNVPQPTVEELNAMIPNLQNQFDLTYFSTIGQGELMNYLDKIAQERQYDSAISCASYFNSNISQWKLESSAFMEWRDTVFTYVIAQITLMQNGQRSIPSFDEFQTELPVIAWPA